MTVIVNSTSPVLHPLREMGERECRLLCWGSCVVALLIGLSYTALVNLRASPFLVSVSVLHQ